MDNNTLTTNSTDSFGVQVGKNVTMAVAITAATYGTVFAGLYVFGKVNQLVVNRRTKKQIKKEQEME